ncbi:hypothetical protein QT972_29985 [Microcoleus sp. herbarium7]|uniref:hypothetical protein n=1 Tax=Microcoleus sp. herbarium7 TaxID=3055435 RepID=UPI002FD625CC
MVDTIAINNGQSLTKDEAKELHKKLNQFYRKEASTKKKAKPLLKPIGDVNVEKKELKIQKSPIDFDDLKIGMPFALDANGTVLYTKTGRERAICLNTMGSVPVGGASVYRVFL